MKYFDLSYLIVGAFTRGASFFIWVRIFRERLMNELGIYVKILKENKNLLSENGNI